MDVAGLEVAGFHIIEEVAGLEVEAHTDDAMDAETPQSSDHWWLQSRPCMDDAMSLRGSNSEKDERQELLSNVNELTHCVSPLEDLMSTVRHEHEFATIRAVQLCHCSTLHCSRVANPDGFDTCCGKYSSQGPHCHARECHGRQILAMSTLVKRQQVLETIMAKVDALPPAVRAALPRCTTRNSQVPYDVMPHS